MVAVTTFTLQGGSSGHGGREAHQVLEPGSREGQLPHLKPVMLDAGDTETS